jgi:MFS transporter, MHS family, proline/betaine transporter
MNRQQIIRASLIGNILEFYDFSLYGIFASALAVTFFPKGDPTVTLLASLATFAVGFFMRPLGGVVFGHIGDRWGRKRALTWSILLMAFPTFLVACLPSYEQIGIASTIILILCRLLQGFCAGGEYNGASIFMLEHLGHKNGGMAGALVSASGAIGGLIASCLGAFLLQSGLPSESWRIAFLLGGILGIVGIYIRRHISEPRVFQEIEQKKKVVKNPLFQSWKENYKAILVTIGMAATSGAFSYTLVVYINLYLNKVIGCISCNSLFFNSLGLLFYIILCPILGIISDKVGHLKIMLLGATGLVIGCYPIFFLLNQQDTTFIILAEILLCLFSSMFIAPLNVTMNKLFPVQVRFSSIGFSYGIGLAAFGGTMPFICTFLIEKTGNLMMPAFYLIFCSLLGLISILYLLTNEAAEKSLDIRFQV